MFTVTIGLNPIVFTQIPTLTGSFWLKSNYFTKYEVNPTPEINQALIPLLVRMRTGLFCTCWISKIEPHGFGLFPMAAGRQTWEIDQEIVQLTRHKEQILQDLQDPVSAGRWATLQQWLAAIQAHLAALQVVVDGRRNAVGLSVTRIH